MLTPQHRRQALLAVLAVALGILLAGFITLVVVAADSSSRSEDRITALQAQLDVEREAAEKRSARATSDRDDLQQQNRALRRQLEAVLEFLRANGLNPPASPNSPSQASSPPGGTSSRSASGDGGTTTRTAPGVRTAPRDRAPRAATSPRPPRATAPAPASGGGGGGRQPSNPRTPLACVLGVCLP